MVPSFWVVLISLEPSAFWVVWVVLPSESFLVVVMSEESGLVGVLGRLEPPEELEPPVRSS